MTLNHHAIAAELDEVRETAIRAVGRVQEAVPAVPFCPRRQAVRRAGVDALAALETFRRALDEMRTIEGGNPRRSPYYPLRRCRRTRPEAEMLVALGLITEESAHASD